MSRVTAFTRFTAFSLSSLAALTDCAPADDAPGAATDTQDLIGAPTDARHRFDVGVCAGPLTGGTDADHGACEQAGTRCSGTLIAPNLVLTARHCVQQIDYGPTATGFCDGTFGAPLSSAPVRVTTSDSVLGSDPKWYPVRRVTVPTGATLCANDIALIELDHPVPLLEAVPAIVSLGRDLARRPPREVAVVGRGVISEVLDLDTFDVTTDEGGLRRRILQHIPFVCTRDTDPGCTTVDYSSPPSDSFTSPTSYFVIGAGTASGDSGSGVLDQAGFALLPRVIGVTSAGTYGSDGRPNFGLISRLDTHRAIILQAFEQAAIDLHLRRDAFSAQAEE